MAVNINATTPQLEVVKKALEAHNSLDINNVMPFFSKDFIFKTFPKSPDLPDLPRKAYLEKHGKFLSLFTKLEVRTKCH
jgi:hypothetical protein